MLKFVHEAIRNIKTTGSVAPSSPMLAGEMTRSLRSHRGSKRVLEVGPGTGAFTAAILDQLRDGDHFDIVELNGAFCGALERGALSVFRAKQKSITVALHSVAIEAAALEGDYDFVICGLPFNNFPVELTQRIFGRMLELMRDGAELTYFEYAALGLFKQPFVGSGGRAAMRSHAAFKKSTARQHLVTRHLVLGNLPPAHAVRLVKRKGSLAPCSASTTAS